MCTGSREESTFDTLRRVAGELGAGFDSAREGSGTAVGLGLISNLKVARFKKEIDGVEYSYLAVDSYAGQRGGSATSSGVYAFLRGAEDLRVKIEETDIVNSVTAFFKRDDIAVGDRSFDKRFYVKGRATPRLRGILGRERVMRALERGLGISPPMYFEIREDETHARLHGVEKTGLLLAGFETRLTWIIDPGEIRTLFDSLHEIVSAIA